MSADRVMRFCLPAVMMIVVFLDACSWPGSQSLRQLPGIERGTGDAFVRKGLENDSSLVSGLRKGPVREDKGHLIVRFLETRNPNRSSLSRYIRGNGGLRNVAGRLDESLILPADVTLSVRECGSVNAFYDPVDLSITLCYELAEHFYSLFRSVGKDEHRSRELMNDAVTFVFLHELGHALIHLYDLPVTGSEEEAADRGSSFICIEELGDRGANAVIAATEAFAIGSNSIFSSRRKPEQGHLPDEQRFYNSLCMIYGSDPEKYAKFEGLNLLSKTRAANCPADYARTTESWADLLKPWRKINS